MKINKSVVILILFLVAMITLTFGMNNLDTRLNKLEGAPMILYENNTQQAVGGVYFPGFGYFVDTRSGNLEHIVGVEYHEACHALIHENRIHYCGIEDNTPLNNSNQNNTFPK